MSQFNLQDYETVEQRIRRFYNDHPQGRIVTDNLTTAQDRAVGTWVVKAEIWIPTWTLPKEASAWVILDNPQGWFLKASGLAFEVDGQGMANKTSALENAETSAIGRALANAGYSGNKRTTREEMEKVERGITPKTPRLVEVANDWGALLEDANTREELLDLFNRARAAKASKATLDAITAKGKTLG